MSANYQFKNLSSGLKELIQEEASLERLKLLMQDFQNKEFNKIDLFFQEKPHLLDSFALKAFKIYYKLSQKQEISARDIAIGEIKDFIANKISKELAYIHQELKENIDFSSVKDFFKNIDDDLQLDFSDYQQEKIKYKLDLLKTEIIFDENNYQEKLATVYQEITELQAQVENQAKIDKETCFKNKCVDCCVYTPPLVTKLEFEYIKTKVDIREFVEKAQKNQLEHQVQFAEKLNLIDLDKQDKKAMNPNNFAHECPFLSESKSCQIHEHRPFACRFYGLSTLDGLTVQACNFYLEQFDKNNRTVLDSRPATRLLAKANRELCQGKQSAGTLSAWLSSDEL